MPDLRSDDVSVPLPSTPVVTVTQHVSHLRAVTCPHCKRVLFKANYGDVEIKCQKCRKIFRWVAAMELEMSR